MDKVNPDFVKAPAIAKTEEALLGLLYLYSEHRIAAFKSDGLLHESDFFTSFGKRVFAFIRDNTDEGVFDDTFLDEAFTPEEVGRIKKIKLDRSSLENNSSTVFSDVVNVLKSYVMDKESEKTADTLEDLNDLINKKRAMMNSKNGKSEGNI